MVKNILKYGLMCHKIISSARTTTRVCDTKHENFFQHERDPVQNGIRAENSELATVYTKSNITGPYAALELGGGPKFVLH